LNTQSPTSGTRRRRTGGLGRCLVPANSFAEYATETNPDTKKKDVVWFALIEDRPLFAFAGIWTEFKERQAIPWRAFLYAAQGSPFLPWNWRN
jgi:putative SOS response-associated peptidase YedK